MSHLFICFNTICHKKSRTWSKMHFKGSKQQVIWELSNTSQGHNTKSFSLFFRCNNILEKKEKTSSLIHKCKKTTTGHSNTNIHIFLEATEAVRIQKRSHSLISCQTLQSHQSVWRKMFLFHHETFCLPTEMPLSSH